MGGRSKQRPSSSPRARSCRRFFTEGPPPTTCPVVCYGTAAVREDCSYTDCAATGEVCLPDPVRCGSGAPPEPAGAANHPEVTLPSVALLGGLTRVALTPPTRLFDTRTPEGSALLARSDGATSGPLGASPEGTLTSFPGAPAGTSALWLNVAAVPLTAPGFLLAHASGASPPISTVNFQTFSELAFQLRLTPATRAPWFLLYQFDAAYTAFTDALYLTGRWSLFSVLSLSGQWS